MPGYILSNQAAHDLEEIHFFGIRTFGAKQAASYAHTLAETFDLLANSPLLARVDARLDPAGAVHRFEHGSHIVFFLIEKNRIFIVRILHKNVDVIRHF